MPEPEAHTEGPAYVEHAPDTRLARHIECYWSIECRLSPEVGQPDRVLPDGCMDILFNLGDPRGRGRSVNAAPVVVGLMTQAIEVEHTGHVELVGVRFRPGGATPWLGLPASELTDQVVGLEELWGAEARRISERLSEKNAEARIALLDEILRERLRRTADPADERVLGASQAIAAHDGRLCVEQLAEAAGLGRRQLERRFLACVGVPPKTASRIARFRSAVSRMHASPASGLSRLALESGYSDQAHLNRDFRDLGGVTPGAYVAKLREP